MYRVKILLRKDNELKVNQAINTEAVLQAASVMLVQQHADNNIVRKNKSRHADLSKQVDKERSRVQRPT